MIFNVVFSFFLIISYSCVLKVFQTSRYLHEMCNVFKLSFGCCEYFLIGMWSFFKSRIYVCEYLIGIIFLWTSLVYLNVFCIFKNLYYYFRGESENQQPWKYACTGVSVYVSVYQWIRLHKHTHAHTHRIRTCV